MVKILSQTGASLSSSYDIQGSKLPIDQLNAEDGVSLVHNMADTQFSERLRGRIVRISADAVLQSADFNSVSASLPTVPCRILGACILTDVEARLGRAGLYLRDPTAGAEQEFPIACFDDSLSPLGVNTRMQDDGNAVGNTLELLNTLFTPMASMVIGDNQVESVPDLALRGVTNAFGAGDVTIIGLLYIAFAQADGIRSFGVKIPGW